MNKHEDALYVAFVAILCIASASIGSLLGARGVLIILLAFVVTLLAWFLLDFFPD